MQYIQCTDFEASQEKRDSAAASRANGDFSAAVELLTQAMEVGAPSVSLLVDRAHCLLLLRRPGAALADCNEALKLNPDSAKALKYVFRMEYCHPKLTYTCVGIEGYVTPTSAGG